MEQLSTSAAPFTSLPKLAPEGAAQPTGFSAGQEQTDGEDDSRASDAQARLVQAEVHASLENGLKEPSSSSPSSEEKGADFDKREEEEEEDGSRKDDYSEGDLIDISAYSGPGEDSGDSQLDDDDDDDDDVAYQPETSCCEMPGLPEEEEPPPANRKIRFSTAPITVSFFCNPSLFSGQLSSCYKLRGTFISRIKPQSAVCCGERETCHVCLCWMMIRTVINALCSCNSPIKDSAVSSYAKRLVLVVQT